LNAPRQGVLPPGGMLSLLAYWASLFPGNPARKGGGAGPVARLPETVEK